MLMFLSHYSVDDIKDFYRFIPNPDIPPVEIYVFPEKSQEEGGYLLYDIPAVNTQGWLAHVILNLKKLMEQRLKAQVIDHFSEEINGYNLSEKPFIPDRIVVMPFRRGGKYDLIKRWVIKRYDLLLRGNGLIYQQKFEGSQPLIVLGLSRGLRRKMRQLEMTSTFKKKVLNHWKVLEEDMLFTYLFSKDVPAMYPYSMEHFEYIEEDKAEDELRHKRAFLVTDKDRKKFLKMGVRERVFTRFQDNLYVVPAGLFYKLAKAVEEKFGGIS